MKKHISFDVNILNNYIEKKCGGKEFYLGCWSSSLLTIDIQNPSNNIQTQHRKNWAVLGNKIDGSDGLIPSELGNDDAELILFKGYLLEEGIHSYSDAEDIKKYWSGNLLKRHNGVFSAVTITDNGNKLNIVTDLFGISPVYYRKVGDVVFFSSSPGLLSLKNDDPDYAAWFMRAVIGNIPGRKSLTKSVEIAHHSSVTTFTKEGKTVEEWYDFKNFPTGDKPVTDLALDQSEQIFTRSMKRCHEINNGKTILPFTSGHDSRRIFAHLLNNDTAFETCTVQIPESNGWDIDGPWAKKIADHFNVKHTLLKYPSANEWHDNDLKRLFVQDGQCEPHTWSVPFFKEHSNEKLCFYDGLGGDLFGYDGWIFVNHINKMKPKKQPSFIKKGIFPDYKFISNMLEGYKNEQPSGANQYMLTFGLWQSRKGTSVWAQQQSKPGQIILYPYFDIDYIENMLEYSLEDKDNFKPQKAILEKYWPKLASFPGSRDIPDNPGDLSKARAANLKYSLQKIIKKTLAIKACRQHLKNILTFPAWMVLILSQYFPGLARKAGWWLQQIVELVYWWQSRPVIIIIKKEEN